MGAASLTRPDASLTFILSAPCVPSSAGDEESVPRQSSGKGPRLEALLDERDHLRIKINLAEQAEGSAVVMEMRRRLIQLDKDIIKHWGKANA